MLILPLEISITRDAKTQKKVYTSLHTQKQLAKALLPKNWQTVEPIGLTHKQVPSYAIRCDDDLVVIDCDDNETTQFIENLNTDNTSYIVESDKGFRHYYYAPTPYYIASPIYRASRLAIGKIDILHGKALVFAPCQHNTTKTVVQGIPAPDSILGYELTAIPDHIVDALVSRLKTVVLSSSTGSMNSSEDYTPLTSYLAPMIEQGIALYSRSENYLDIQPLLQVLTPARYKGMVQPDYHPDRVHDGEGISYLQALSTKLAQDPSVSVDLHTEMIALIAQQLWSSPLSDSELRAFLSNLTTQRYSATGKLIFRYDPNATQQPLVSINSNSYMPVYRTLKDDYILTKPDGGVEIIPGTSNFKRAIGSKNYDLLIDGKRVNLDTNIAMKRTQDAMKSCQVVSLAYRPSGEIEDNGSLYYNRYVPTKYLSIIRGTYLADSKSDSKGFPTIAKILKSLTYDHEGTRMYQLFLEFLSRKLKTLDYTPLVFQLMGNRGVGKGLLMLVLEQLTEATTQVSFGASNAQFNAHTEGKMFLNEDEGLVSQRLVNMAKKLSGSKTILIEKKGVDAEPQRNIGTYIVTTNKTTPLAETVDDRRFITFSSFKAPRLVIKNVETLIALELEAFALYLRDIKITNQDAYMDARVWHDSVHFANFEELQAATQHLPSRIANFMYQLHTLTGREIHEQLTDLFGKHYHYINTIKNKQILAIPLSKHPQLIRTYDSSTLTHEVTREQLKSVELDQYITLDKNGAKTIYGTNFYKLNLNLSNKQRDDWQASLEGFDDLNDLGDLDTSEGIDE